MKILQKMLKKEMTLQILNSTQHFLKEKLGKVMGLIKGELGGQIMKEFVGLRAKLYSYLKDSNDEDKKAESKSTKKCAIKRKIKFKDYKNCLEAAQI